jgi:hypothetical protein
MKEIEMGKGEWRDDDADERRRPGGMVRVDLTSWDFVRTWFDAVEGVVAVREKP